MRWLKSAVLASLTLAMLPLQAILCSPQNSSFVHQKRYAMGTIFEIVIYDEDLPAQMLLGGPLLMKLSASTA